MHCGITFYLLLTKKTYMNLKYNVLFQIEIRELNCNTKFDPCFEQNIMHSYRQYQPYSLIRWNFRCTQKRHECLNK